MKKIFFVSLFCLGCGGLFAYSAFGEKGFLQQNLGRDFYSAGSGNTGSADLFRFNAGLINPSMAVTADNAKFSTGFSASWRYFEKGEGQEHLSRARCYDLPFFNVIVPYKDNFFAFDFSSGYSGSYEFGQNSVEEDFFANFYKVGLVYARKTPWVNFGVGAHYYAGSVQKDLSSTTADRFIFEDTVEDLNYKFDSSFVKSEDFESKALTYSIGLSKKIGDIAVGAYYTPAITLDGDNEFSTTSTVYQETQYANVATDSSYTLSDSVVVTGSQSKELKLPEIFGFGFSYQISQEWKLSVDADYQVWQECSYYDNSKMHNTLNFGVGVAYDRGVEPWYWNVPLRVGYYRKEFPFEVSGKRIIEQGASFGFDIPVNNLGGSRVSVALQYFTRGSKADNGYNEQEGKISIGFTGFDIFGSRRRLTQKRDIPISSQDYDQY